MKLFFWRVIEIFTRRITGDYTGADYRQVEVFGAWCEQIKGATATSASSNKINFVLGCPGEVVQ